MVDVVWLKKDVRLHDHAAFSEISKSDGPVLLLYLFEPDQLKEPSVHGSHLLFIFEGLLDLEKNLCERCLSGKTMRDRFTCLSICHFGAVEMFEFIHTTYDGGIKRILAHEETGHWQSFMRDKAVRKWCRSNRVSIIEFNQTGVTRCLKDRDDFTKRFKAHMAKPRCSIPRNLDLTNRLASIPDLPGKMTALTLDLCMFDEVPEEHRCDRQGREQFGGESHALQTLDSFLQERGTSYSGSISSPNSAWTSCSRLSPYLTWGHISLKYTIQKLKERQEELRGLKNQGMDIGTSWLKSLSAFTSRLTWRSHFIQKLESEPMVEKRDMCPAYQGLRRQEGDWNQSHYDAWASGNTGYPFVDACMRCLLHHGWLNFRMRAMVVSFATYNLWLDWKRLAPHLARVFLDYEPGIHYPQLQMQSGTTGINAMRVYSVTKQSKEQDPEGAFIRRFIPELRSVPKAYIHEPWKMPACFQRQYRIKIGKKNRSGTDEDDLFVYPEPIVNESESAKEAKAKVAAIRNMESTKESAKQVYQKHGSRSRRANEMNGRKSDITGISTKGTGGIQGKINFWTVAKGTASNTPKRKASSLSHGANAGKNQKRSTKSNIQDYVQPIGSQTKGWACKTCTFLNTKPLALACGVCGSTKE